MGYRLLFHPDIVEDMSTLDARTDELILSAIEKRLSSEPMKYGKRLSRGLKGFWKLRVSVYRVIYRAEGEEVWILKVGHRREAYSQVGKRLRWRPDGRA